MRIKACGIKPGCRAVCSCWKYREDVKAKECLSFAPCSMQIQIDAPEKDGTSKKK